jgi:hypothetical protein
MPETYCAVRGCGAGKEPGKKFCADCGKRYDELLGGSCVSVEGAKATMRHAKAKWSGRACWPHWRYPLEWPDGRENLIICIRSSGRPQMIHNHWTVRRLWDLGLAFFIFCCPEDDLLKADLDHAATLGLLDFIVLGPRGADKTVAFADEIQPAGVHLLYLDNNIGRMGIFNGTNLQQMSRTQFKDLCKAGWRHMSAHKTKTWSVNFSELGRPKANCVPATARMIRRCRWGGGA